MNTRKRLISVLLAGGLICAAVSPGESAVIVGSSSLIGTLDYSDTFTLTANGGAAERIDTVFPVSATGRIVENNYGNPSRTWRTGAWSLNQDSSAWATPQSPYPGTSGAGSDTGLTQHGTAGLDYGVQYGLRDEFVVQFDAVQVSDRIDITAGTKKDTIFAPGLTVFFKPAGNATEIGLFNGVPFSLANTGFSSPTIEGQWYNYAVRFDIPDSEIEIFIDEVSLGVVDLTTFNGGTHNTASNAFVNIGGATGATDNRLWTDNFQVGQVGSYIVPEPSSCFVFAALGLLGLIGYRLRRQR